MASKTVLCIGELLWDILPDQTLLGGAPANLAYRVHSLGDKALLATRLGKDALGEKALLQLKELGLHTALVQLDAEHPTGTVKVFLDAENKPSYTIISPAAYDFIEVNPLLIQSAENADCICFGTLARGAHEDVGARLKRLGFNADFCGVIIFVQVG